MNHDKNELRMNRACYCGLFCDSCTLYIGTTEDPMRLERLTAKFQKSVEELRCLGCRSEQLSFYCVDCKIKECAREKGLDFCSQCESYPCQMLQDFKVQRPHRNELYESLELLKEAGFDPWFEKMDADYSCSSCKTINSAYDAKCRSCGNEPSSEYYKRNKTSIEAALQPKNG